MTAIAVDAVSKRYRLFRERNQSIKTVLLRGRRSVHEDFWALREVTLDIPAGSTYALIGENGSGKSTLLKCIARILLPDHGSVRAAGRMAALLELGSGFHPELSGRENVYLNGSILGMGRKQVDARFDEIVAFSGVERFIDQPVKTYSSGMYVRLGFSVAISVEPEILLVDEVLAVGDAAFQDKCMDKFRRFRDDGRTVVLVTHSMASVKEMCDQAAWLEHGELRAVGDPDHLADDYLEAVLPGDDAADGSVAAVRVEGTGEGVTSVGGPLRAEVDLVRGDHEGDLAVAVAVVDHAGHLLAEVRSAGSEAVLPAAEAKGSVALDLRSLPLAPGTYSLRVAVYRDGGEPVPPDRRRHGTDFAVAAVGDAPLGTVVLEHRWEQC